MKVIWSLATGVLFGLLGAGAVFVASSPPRGAPIQLIPPPPPAPIRIHVTGAVLNPGVFSLETDSRVEDAITAAGGLLENANAESVNLAAQLQDGDQVSIPAQRVEAVISETTTTTQESQGNIAEQAPTVININTATPAELELLPRVGPVTAAKIIDYRQTNGDFSSIEEIQKVSGIGPATFEKMQGMITVGE